MPKVPRPVESWKKFSGVMPCLQAVTPMTATRNASTDGNNARSPDCHANALALLKAKMIRMEEEKREAEYAAYNATKSQIAWGSQIRSYVLQPYRLEMGTSLANPSGRHLYAFWGDTLARALNASLAEQGDDVLVNLASEEYSRAALTPALRARVVTPQFREEKDGRFRMVSFHAKRARGLMAGWILRNRLDRPASLREFDAEGYRFNPDLSEGDTLVFTRQMFQGKFAADVSFTGSGPCFVTFQNGSFRADKVEAGGSPAPVETVQADVPDSLVRNKPQDVFKEAKQASAPYMDAKEIAGYEKEREALGEDPYAYVLGENEKRTMRALNRYQIEQGLMKAELPIEGLFVGHV